MPVFASRSTRLTDSTARSSITFNVRYGKRSRRPSVRRARLPPLSLAPRCSAPRFVAAGGGHGRAGSSDNAALCPGQTCRPPSLIKRRAVMRHAPAHNWVVIGAPPPVRGRRPPWSGADARRRSLSLWRNWLGTAQRGRSARHALCKKQHIARRAPLLTQQSKIDHTAAAFSWSCCLSAATSVNPRKPSLPFSSARARL